MPCPLLIFCQSDYLIQIVDIHSHTEQQTVQIYRTQLIWIYTVCKGRAYPGSAGLGLILFYSIIYYYIIFYSYRELKSAKDDFLTDINRGSLLYLRQADISWW